MRVRQRASGWSSRCCGPTPVRASATWRSSSSWPGAVADDDRLDDENGFGARLCSCIGDACRRLLAAPARGGIVAAALAAGREGEIGQAAKVAAGARGRPVSAVPATAPQGPERHELVVARRPGCRTTRRRAGRRGARATPSQRGRHRRQGVHRTCTRAAAHGCHLHPATGGGTQSRGGVDLAGRVAAVAAARRPWPGTDRPAEPGPGPAGQRTQPKCSAWPAPPRKTPRCWSDGTPHFGVDHDVGCGTHRRHAEKAAATAMINRGAAQQMVTTIVIPLRFSDG